MTDKFAEMLLFFAGDYAKIILLLFFMVTFVGFLRTYISEDKIRKWLAKGKGLSYFLASAFGAVTPFCSCSSIPIFLSFMKARIPLGISFAFLITSPIINEYLAALMFGFFGWKITVLYIISGMLVGIISGFILGKMKLEKYIEKDFYGAKTKGIAFKSKRQRIEFGINEAVFMIKKIWLWLAVGIGIGAVIHNYIPDSLIQAIISGTGPFMVPIAVLIGVPIYGNCVAIVPVAVALFQKGIPLGTALSFMMAISALSLPEAIVLRRAMKLKLIILFFGIVTLAIIATGYMFNFLQTILL